MRRFWTRRPDPVLYVIVALLCAAILVVYLQHRALTALDRQTALIIEKISEQTAEEISHDIRDALEGPVLDTLRAVNHPELRDGRFDLVLSTYEDSLLKYPQVERFLFWSTETEARFPGEVLFFSGAPPAPGDGVLPVDASGTSPWYGFWRDPDFGSFIFRETHAYRDVQQIYTALEYERNGRSYDVFVRQYWVDAARDSHLALLGFVVDVERVGPKLLPELFRQRLMRRLQAASTAVSLELELLDDQERVFFASTDRPLATGVRRSLAAQSFPDHLRNRMSTGLPERTWYIRIGPITEELPVALSNARAQTFWLSTLSVLLMLVALAVAVRGQRRAVQLARMQTEFASHVSHQLKTPLALLTTVTETLALDRVRSPEKLSQYVAILREETAHLSTLVQRILEFSRVHDRGHRYEPEAVAIEALVRETVEAFRRTSMAAGIDIRVETGASPTVAADPAAIEQVVVNLLDNAIKYSATAREVLVRVDRRGSDALIEVIDYGVGIEPSDRKRIFERFYRGAATRGRRGFGLGLSIVKEIVTAHRGRVEVQSAPGRGSRFRVLLPLRHPEPLAGYTAPDMAARQAP